MVPISLSLRNFLSYGEGVPPLNFTAFHVACISGPNGHGKSALLDAVTWALWGEARKAGTEHKPDEGLLRTGATEMQVAFEFNLEGERYRVARSYRKTGRSSASSLELQAFSEGNFKTLSEGGSLRKTQERLNALLRMTYDTFINSAFILQGRADEFTRRSARERKTILGEILALSRYDDLSALARTHAQHAEAQAGQARAQLAEIEAAIDKKGGYQKEIKAVSTQWEALEEELAEAEVRLETLRAEQARLDLHRQELADLRTETSRLNADRAAAETQASAAREALAACCEVLDHRDDILAAVGQQRALQAEEARLQQKLRTLRTLEKGQNELEKDITEARHRVESRLGEWELRLTEAEREIKEAEDLLKDRQEIKAGTAALQRAREKEKAWEHQREKRETLEQRVRDLERQVESARSEIQVALKTHQERMRQLEENASEHPRLQEAVQTACRQLEEIRKLEEKRDQIREQGTGLKARIEAAHNRLTGLAKDLKEVEKGQAALDEMQDARCPLCGSDLDPHHRSQVNAQLAEQAEALKATIAQIEGEIRASEAERETCRRRYQEVKNRLVALAGATQEAAQAEAALRGAEAAAAAQGEQQQQIAALEAQAKHLETAHPEARALTEARKELERLGYDPAAHRALRDQMVELSAFETRAAHLHAAEERRRRAADALPGFREKRDLARTWLGEKRYAQQAQEALKTRQAEIRDLGYDSTHHHQVIQNLETLQDAAEQQERLQAAEREAAGAQARLEAADKRSEEVQARTARAKARTTELEAAVKTGEATAKETEQLQGRIREKRPERDRLLQERATLQTQLDRCKSLEGRLDEEQQRLKTAKKKTRIYTELFTAFGKDGIQALIIEQAIPEIEEEANRILSRLTDNRTQIALESLRDLKKGGTRETLEVKISDELGERSYELYSGGESFRVDFAVRIALSQLLARRAGTRLCTLVIDEGFGTQDAEGLDHLVEAIQAISNDFEKILVITHVEALKQAFPVHIEITKYPDIGSRFEILQ